MGQNDKLYAHYAGDLPEGSKSHLPHRKSASLMMWAAVATDGSRSLLILINADVKVNSEAYVEMVDEKVLRWITETFVDHYNFAQDRVSVHTSNLTQE